MVYVVLTVHLIDELFQLSCPFSEQCHLPLRCRRALLRVATAVLHPATDDDTRLAEQ